MRMDLGERPSPLSDSLDGWFGSALLQRYTHYTFSGWHMWMRHSRLGPDAAKYFATARAGNTDSLSLEIGIGA